MVLISLNWLVLSTQVGVFSDGSVHINIVDYIREHLAVPTDDFSGQINSNFRQPRSYTVPMIYPQNIYIFFASWGLLSGVDSVTLMDIGGLIILLISSIFFFSLARILTRSQKIAFIALFLFLLLPIWYWIFVRRIVEPISLLFCFTALYIALQTGNSQMTKKYAYLLGFFLFVIFYTKQSNIYFLGILGVVVLLRTLSRKYMFRMSIAFLLLGFPGLWYSYHLLGAISPVPPGIPFVDTVLLNPRRKNQTIQERESKLNEITYNDQIKKITYQQFVENIQISPLHYVKTAEYKKVLQNFLPLQIFPQGTQGYHLSLPAPLANFNLLLFGAGMLFLFLQYKKQKSYLLFAIISFLFVASFALKFTVFRYYINSVLLYVLIFAYGAYALYASGTKTSSFLLYAIGIVFALLTVTLELRKNTAYQYSIGHRLTNNTGGITELVTLGAQKELLQLSGDVFTPVLEVAYYLDKNIYRDEKFFFIQHKQDLLFYLKQAGIRYVLNPFYSTTIGRSNRKYYNGVPVDSLLGKMLAEQECFSLVYDAVAFDLYLMEESCDLDKHHEHTKNY